MDRLKMETFKNAEEKKLAVEAALLLGFQAESAVFPVIGADGEIPIPKKQEALQKLWRLKEEPASEEFESATAHPGPVFDLDFRQERGLECMFQTGAFLKDENHDLLPDKLDVKLVLPENADASIIIAACNVAFRFGMETTGYEGRIVAEKGYEGNAVVFEKADKTEMVLKEQKEAVQVYIRGNGKELEEFAAALCSSFPKIDGWRTWRDALMDMTDDFILRGADGQAACLAALTEEQPGRYEVYGSPEITGEQKKGYPDVAFKNYKSGRKVYEKVYELPWEVDTFEEIWNKEVYPLLKSQDQVKVAGALSEDRVVREKLIQKMQNAVEEKGASLIGAELICAYKQGFSWIDEIVIPAVKDSGADKVEIYFKPFLPEGQTDWLDENGATPSRPDLKANTPDKWYDLPIRYLQELYPIEDVLVKALGIGRDRIVFLPYEGSEELTYRCRVMRADEVCYEASYQVQSSERPYLDAYPQLGKVHPATGYIKVWVNDAEVLFRKIRTDLEEVWDVYQAQVLPECRAYIEEKTGGDIRADLQPFFQELRLDVTLSEPDYRVGCREDLISSLDALHEDMYFAGSDYFKNYGVQRGDITLDAPGLILPLIHKQEGKPVFKVTLLEPLMEKAYIFRDGGKAAEQGERKDVSLKIDSISYENGKMCVSVRVKGIKDNFLKGYAALFAKGQLRISREIDGIDVIRLVGDSRVVFEADVPKQNKPPKCRKITEIDLHENELIGYDAYLEIIEELKQVPGIEVFRTAVSYTGRELYAIWLKPSFEGYLSMTKRLTCHPSEVINARHHANEVSSTNAAFILLKKLLTEDIYKELPEKLNLVLVPVENVDGAAIHYELQKEHPYWKFHVARFNSLGKEFYHEHFKEDTIHTEAMGLSRLFEKYVPDMIVDNHGVPSHEWEQQFSGYTSPSYKGFWLPRSLLYGYFWYVTNPEYKSNYPVNKRMEDVIADKIAEDEEMARWNRQWSEQFEKYAHAWMPKLFPANYYKNMINYWIPFPSDPAHRYPSIRFPWITTVAYTSEVADETAQGDYLNLCARAHVAHDEATLQMLLQARHVFDCRYECQGERIFARYLRQRPMIV